MTNKQENSGGLICVDWGSTNFRAFLVNHESILVDTLSSDQGFLNLLPNEFEEVLYQNIYPWIEKQSIPILLSGMVGSKKGWKNTPYLTCSVSIEDIANNLNYIENTNELNIAIVSGIENSSDSNLYDVARGEEIQVFGALSIMKIDNSKNITFCLPGTHSKWLTAKDNKIIELSTHLTGEIYNLLSKNSILAPDISTANQPLNNNAFLKGVKCSQSKGGLANHVFTARTKMLKGKLHDHEVEDYLSGILIGTEIKEMRHICENGNKLIVVGSKYLNNIYSLALGFLGIEHQQIDSEEASIAGLYAIAKIAKFL